MVLVEQFCYRPQMHILEEGEAVLGANAFAVLGFRTLNDLNLLMGQDCMEQTRFVAMYGLLANTRTCSMVGCAALMSTQTYTKGHDCLRVR